MKEDYAVRKLVELIFVKKYEVTSEMQAPNSPFPPCLLTNDFTQKLSHVLSVRKAILYIKWAAGFNVFYERDVLSDHKSYLVSIIFNCLKEVKYQSNVFESFITLCSTVDFYSGETLRHLGLNYCDLNTDIVMKVYTSVLKATFIRRNGFRRLIEYISKHKYISWVLELVKRSVNEDNTSDPLVEATQKRIVNEISNELQNSHLFYVDKDELKINAGIIANYVLSTTSVKLPTFSSDHDSKEAEDSSSLNDPSKLQASTKPMNQEDVSTTSGELSTASKDHDLEEAMIAHSLNDQSKLHASTRSMTQENLKTTSVEPSTLSNGNDFNSMVNTQLNEATVEDGMKGTTELDLNFKPIEMPQGCSRPYAKTHIEAKQPENITRYESCVQAVIKYNQSKTAGYVPVENSIHKTAGEVLEHLKDTIKSAIKLLDEYDE